MRCLTFLAVAVLACSMILHADPTTITDVLWHSGSTDPNFYDPTGDPNGLVPSEQTSGPVVCDINNDGMPEVIVTGRDEIWVFNWEHQSANDCVNHWSCPSGYEFCSPATIAHLSADGLPWVVVGASRAVAYGPCEGCEPCPGNAGFPENLHVDICYHWESAIKAWKVNSSQVDSVTTSGLPGRLTTPAAADADGDCLDELCFVGSYSYGRASLSTDHMLSLVGVYFFKYSEQSAEFAPRAVTGTWFAASDEASSAPQIAQTAPAAGNISGDERPEFVTQCGNLIQAYAFPTGGGNVTVLWTHALMENGAECWPGVNLDLRYDNAGAVPWNYRISDSFRCPGPVLADVDGTGGLSIFVQTRTRDAAGTPCLWKLHGASGQVDLFYDPQRPIGCDDVCMFGLHCMEDNLRSELAICDDHADGHPYIFGTMFYGCQPQGGREGDSVRTRRWYPDLTPYEEGGIFPYTVSVDINAPFGEISSADMYTPALLPSEDRAGFSTIFPASGIVLHEQCTDVHFVDKWVDHLNEGLGTGVQSNVTAADLNGNGLLEYVYTAHEADGYSRLFALETTLPYNPEKIEWSGYRNGPAHTGLYAQPVTGNQSRSKVTWQGRVIVKDVYNVMPGDTLEIKPGTVVEMGADAEIFVYGVLKAIGVGSDSIWFKPDGNSDWSDIFLYYGGVDSLQRCVFHGGGYVYVQSTSPVIRECHFYDMTYKAVSFLYSTNNTLCQGNLIEDCGFYGIEGAVSAGRVDANTIRNCGRAGISWIGDNVLTLEAPYITNNEVRDNGTNQPIAGGYFNSTTAKLACNVFEYNAGNEIACENSGNIVMNGNFQRYVTNTLRDVQADVTCDGQNATKVLMRLNGSTPQISNGSNNFVYTNANGGTYLFDNQDTPQIVLTGNFFTPSSDLPSSSNPHFCTERSFTATSFLSSLATCSISGNEAMSGASGLFQQAAGEEDNSNFAAAQSGFASVMAQYPDSEEALWATRASLRAGLHANVPGSHLHDSLYSIWSDEGLPDPLRHAARREAVWALISGEHYTAAGSELQAIMSTSNDPDSLWAAVTQEIMTLCEQSGPQTQSAGNDPHVMMQRLSDFHDRINHLMGRQTDSEVLAAGKPVVQSEKLSRAYPNPFNNTVNIAFELPQDVKVRLDVFNLMGQKVATLANEPMKAGSHTFTWSGKTASSGVYFYRLVAGKHVETQKLMLLK